MKIRVVSSREEIFTLNPNERVVHLAFRPSNKDIFGLVEMFLEMQRIELIEGDVWGHRKDLNEYYSIPSSVIEKIREMKVEGKSAEDIGVQISRESKLDPEMIAYILNKEAFA